MFADFSERDLVVEVETEDTRVVMSALCRVSVLSTCVIAERAFVVAQALEELLEIRLVEAPELREVFIVIGECDEAVFVVRFRFVNASHGPLS